MFPWFEIIKPWSLTDSKKDLPIDYERSQAEEWLYRADEL
jgi:hypothetical protein